MKTLTWDELAKIHDKVTGGIAKTRPMDSVFDWAVKRKDLFKLNKNGSLSFIGSNKYAD